jgi:hypothetical protein
LPPPVPGRSPHSQTTSRVGGRGENVRGLSDIGERERGLVWPTHKHGPTLSFPLP